MKIQNNLPPVITGGAPRTERRGVSSDSTKAGDSVSSETVTLSPTASQLAASSTSDSFDAEKVERIRQAIADGRMHIRADVIADRMLAEARVHQRA